MTPDQVRAMRILEKHQDRIDRYRIAKRIQQLTEEVKEMAAKKRPKPRPKPKPTYP